MFMRYVNKIAVVILAIVFVLGFGSNGVRAATAVSLGTADSFAILADSGITIGGAVNTSTITGDIGTFPIATITGIGNAVLIGTNHAGDATTQGAKTALTTAYLNAEAQTLPSVTTVVASTIDSFSGTGYTLAPGIYKSGSTMGITGTLTLNGNATDVWIFQAGSSLTTAGASNIVLTGGAQPCNIFWQVGSSATLGAASVFKGNILALTSIGLGTTANVEGRVLAQNGTVTLDGSNVITKPTCAAVSSPYYGEAQRYGNITVVKTVVNDNGGTKTVADFPLFIDGIPAISGIAKSFLTPSVVHVVTETANSNYTKTFSGDCDASGKLNLNPGANQFCIITNDDIGAPVVVPPIPPIIDVVKVPDPLALPAGPGQVTYTYTLRNIGKVPVTDITMVGDTCSPITLISGDANADKKLDLTETWQYRCSTRLTETHTNTVVATGWANGLSASDIASAIVVVGKPIVPPLIHVTKVPEPLTLASAGGKVVYTEKVTNPGAVALSNVKLIDDKCSPVKFISGDTNNDSKLDTNETWTYTCEANLTKNTTNTAIATGEANGFAVRDLAVVTVPVSAPNFPNTGFAPGWRNTLIVAGMVVLGLVALVLLKKRKI